MDAKCIIEHFWYVQHEDDRCKIMELSLGLHKSNLIKKESINDVSS
jgi:hypothetical protein